ncbi:chloramphenicol acetyltransferase [Clostridioides difficile]|nr:chloramphenicol acetyltransferase [Clostridioides difficile]
MKYKYTKIDLNEWSRGKLFKFYIDNMRIVMSLTVDIDVTKLIEFTKSNNLKFYPSMIWVVSKIVNAHDEFKYSWDSDGNLIKWEYISPSYVDFHKEDENFTKLVTSFSDDLFKFHKIFMIDKVECQNNRAIVENQPPNFFDVSCLPWVKYKHFDVHIFDEGKFLAPVITWGKYEMEHGNYIMPLTMNIHHSVADGFHLSRFFNEVQELINSLN